MFGQVVLMSLLGVVLIFGYRVFIKGLDMLADAIYEFTNKCIDKDNRGE